MMDKQAERGFFNNVYQNNPRKAVGQIYSIIRGRNELYEDLIYSEVEGLRVLEYGCGTGSHSLEIARRGGLVTGIDISEMGISKAQARAEAALVQGAEYLVMDAEEMEFEDHTFDLVIGEGILHHLDLEKSYSEISRVLKPGGRAIFMEPLGHNPAIEIFRMLTPKLRTADEHPLRRSDLKLADKYFSSTKLHFFHLISFGSLIFLRTPFFYKTVEFLDKMDAFLFKVLPVSGMLAWYSIMVMSTSADQK